MTSPDSAPRTHPLTRADSGAWLSAHHGDTPAVWMVLWKATTGRPRISYDDAVSEALAFGWVDSLPRRLDDERTMLYFSRRKPTSAWSRPNKKRVEELRRQGLMSEAGERAIAQAKLNGAWSRLDDVEDLVEPADLTAPSPAFPPHALTGTRSRHRLGGESSSGSSKRNAPPPAPNASLRQRGSQPRTSVPTNGQDDEPSSPSLRHPRLHRGRRPKNPNAR